MIGAVAASVTSPGFLTSLRQRLPIFDESLDAWLRRMMRWHFSPTTGSPFWLAQRASLDFDPLQDIRDVDDLVRFGLFDKRILRTVPVRQLIPRGFAGRPLRVFESGGTTGPPCRVIDVTTGEYNVAAYRAMLEMRDLAGGDLLAMTPSGPHAYGWFVARLARSWHGLAHLVDFDPRWVKRSIAIGQPVEPYVSHLISQTRVLLEQQEPSLLFTTSKLLLRLVPELPQPLGDYGVRAVCTGGTSCNREEIRYLKETYLQDVQWIDTYGNTLVGHALQGDPWTDWADRAYYLLPPLGILRVVEPADWRRQVMHGERGQVLATTLLEDLFIPNLLERDAATRVGAHPWFPWDGVADVGPHVGPGVEPVLEGVY